MKSLSLIILLFSLLSYFSIDIAHDGYNNLEYDIKLLNGATKEYENENHSLYHHNHHHEKPKETLYVKTVTKSEENTPILPTPTSAPTKPVVSNSTKSNIAQPTPNAKTNTTTVTTSLSKNSSSDIKKIATSNLADVLEYADNTEMVFISEGKKRTKVETVDIKTLPSNNKKGANKTDSDKVNVKLFVGNILNKEAKNGCGPGTFFCNIKKQCFACPKGTTSHKGATSCFSVKKHKAKRVPTITITTIEDKIQYPKKSGHHNNIQSLIFPGFKASKSESMKLPRNLLKKFNNDFSSKSFFNIPTLQTPREFKFESFFNIPTLQTPRESKFESFFNIPTLQTPRKSKLKSFFDIPNLLLPKASSPKVTSSVIIVGPSKINAAPKVKAPVLQTLTQATPLKVEIKFDAPKILGSSNASLKDKKKKDFIIVNCGKGFYFHPNRTCQPCPRGTVSGPNPTACTAI